MPASFSKTIIVVVVLALALIGLTAGAAFAAPPYDGADFGDHVSDMAKAGHLGEARHLGAIHNPGMHQGITGWQEMHMMPMAPTP